MLQSVQQQQRIRKDAALAKLVAAAETAQWAGTGVGAGSHGICRGASEEGQRCTPNAPHSPCLPLHPQRLSCTHSIQGQKFKPSPVKKLEDRHSFNDSLSLADDLSPHSQNVNCKMRPDEDGNPMSGRLSKAFAGMLSFTGKRLLVVASVAAFLVVSELNLKSKNISMRGPSQTSPLPVPEPKLEEKLEEKLDLKPILECPVGYKRIEDNGIVKCIVKERVELPFLLAVSTPDILYGRG